MSQQRPRPAPKRRTPRQTKQVEDYRHPPLLPDFIQFAEAVLYVAFLCLTIAAIITTDGKLMFYSIVVGIAIGFIFYRKSKQP